MGTFGGALEKRGIDASDKRLTCEVEGEIETENQVLVIKRIHATYHLQAADKDRSTIERVYEVHHRACPVYMSLHKAIDITTELIINEE